MSQMCKNNYESPFTKVSRVELEDGICAASGTPVVGEGKNQKVSIDEQRHGTKDALWNGTGFDINAEWEGQN